MPREKAIDRLREIAAKEERLEALRVERDNLIRYAIQGERRSEREVAEAAGLAPSRVHQIVHRTR